MKVCWANSKIPTSAINPQFDVQHINGHRAEWPLKLKQHVRKVISENYNSETTGIQYTGWEDCTLENLSSYDAVIITADDSSDIPRWTKPDGIRGRSTIGYESNNGKPTVYLKASYEQIHYQDVSYQLELTTLHEFGHLAGLRHEHAIGRDRNCNLINFISTEKIGETAEQYSIYDPNSIMNYCWIFSLKDVTGINFVTTPRYNFWEATNGDHMGVIKDPGLNLVDKTLFQVTYLPKNRRQWEIKVKLSTGDIHALRCLYFDKDGSCTKSFNPNEDR